MGCTGKVFKTLYGALALLGFIWLLLVGILESGGTNAATNLNQRPEGRFKHDKMMGEGEKLVSHAESDLNFMSKRRVPNGPDPIHNRRAGNSRQPPGQA